MASGFGMKHDGSPSKLAEAHQ